MLNERKLTENEIEQRKIALKGLLKNKRALVKKYGADAEKVMYGIATKQAKKKVENMNLDKLKEMIQDALTVKEASPFVLAANAAKDSGKKEFEFPKGSGKMHPVTLKKDLPELDERVAKIDEILDEERQYNQEEELRLDLIARRKFDCDFKKCTDEQKAEVLKDKDKVGVKEQIKETLRFIKEHNPDFTNEEIKSELEEIKELGSQLNEKLCKKGEAYRKRRMAAGEKSSAYLSGRAVKVCKGQMSGKKKKKASESLNEVSNSDIVKALAKVVDMEPKDVVAKIKADKEEVNEIAITTAITIAGLLPAVMELVGGAFNKAKNSFKLNEKEKTEYLALQQFYKEAKDKDEKKRLKKEMEPYESKIGNWFKDAGHSLHKAYTAPIRGLLWMASKLAPKDSSLKDKEKREKIANVIYAAAMIGIAGYGVASHIGHLKGVSDVAITIADSIKGGKSIKDAALGGLELLGLV